MERWIELRTYNISRTSDKIAPTDTLRVRLAKWLALRRVRTTLFIATFLVTIVLSIHFIDLTTVSNAVKQATKQSPSQIESTTPSKPTLEAEDQVIWSDFAYIQYVTNENYLCNSLMILESLYRLQSKADRVMMYLQEWQISGRTETGTHLTTASRLLTQARDEYSTKLIHISVQHLVKGDPTWQDSFTKLLAFNQTQYKRLISLDSDATVRQHMDELFLSPSSPVAMPRAYWLDQPFLSSRLILLEPSAIEWQKIQDYMTREDSGFDMDILNAIYKDSCMILPHRPYNMISGEFRGSAEKHRKYLGSEEKWNGTVAWEEAKFVHFSDWPLPKPWIKASDSLMAERQPKCVEDKNSQAVDCTDRDIWLGLYRDFSDRNDASAFAVAPTIRLEENGETVPLWHRLDGTWVR